MDKYSNCCGKSEVPNIRCTNVLYSSIEPLDDCEVHVYCRFHVQTNNVYSYESEYYWKWLTYADADMYGCDWTFNIQ